MTSIVKPKQKTKLNRTKTNLLLDILLVFAFVLEMEEHFTGLPMHEVLGLAFAAGLILHIILHWDWVVNITKTFIKKVIHESRVNYALNVALFVDLIVVTVTGIAISRTLGLNFNVDRSWQMIHVISSELSLVLIGLHVGMHWKWIATNVGKYMISPITSKLPKQSVKPIKEEVIHGAAQQS